MFSRKHILTLFLILLVYGWFFVTSLQKNQTETNVLGASENIYLFTQPESGRSLILNAINSAQKEILVEVYLLSDKEIIKALEDAKVRGVRVNVILEKHPFGGGNVNPSSQKELEENGISFKWSSPSFALTHEKTITIDASKTFILGQNLTTSAFEKNREYNVLDTNPKDVEEVRNIFIADWERKSFEPPTTNLIVSPNNSRGAISSLIKNSINTIDMEIEDINDENIVSLLSQKAKLGKIRLIIPTFSQISSNKKAAEKLLKEGVEVRILSSPYVHAKLILSDVNKAYVGSVNLSAQSMDENREVGIILSESESIKSLFSTFEKDWQKAKPL